MHETFCKLTVSDSLLDPLLVYALRVKTFQRIFPNSRFVPRACRSCVSRGSSCSFSCQNRRELYPRGKRPSADWYPSSPKVRAWVRQLHEEKGLIRVNGKGGMMPARSKTTLWSDVNGIRCCHHEVCGFMEESLLSNSVGPAGSFPIYVMFARSLVV